MRAVPDDPVVGVSKRGVDGAAALCGDLNENTIRATLRWFDSQDNASPRLLAWKLRNGGVYVPDDEEVTTGMVWKSDERMAWIEAHMPEQIEADYGFRAEVALVGVVKAGLPPSAAKVRELMRGELVSEDTVARTKPRSEPQKKAA